MQMVEAVISAYEVGRHIADAMGPTNKNLIMQNHGLLTAGGTVAEAAAFFIRLGTGMSFSVLDRV